MMAQPGFEQETFKTLLEEYLDQVNKVDGLQRMRGKAWNHFLELGLPTNRTEVYRYVKLRHLLSQHYQLAEEKVEVDVDQLAACIYPECRQSIVVFVNGHYAPHLSNIQAIAPKVVLSNLQEAIRTFGAFLNNFWAKSLREETDAFAVLNGALHRNGAFIYIPPKAVIDVPIQILHLVQISEQPTMSVPRLNIFVGSGSEAKFAVSQVIQGNGPYFVNQVVEMALEEGAQVHYAQNLCEGNSNGWHLDAFRAYLKRDSKLETVSVTEGSTTVRNDYRISLIGENAEVLLNGVWMLADKRESHTNVLIDHQVPYCRSFQLFKGVLNDFSRSSFEGKIMVRQAAQKTEAFQLNNNLLLHDHAHADSKPNLEIFADDVKASHGATVGRLNEDQLFYMKTRGFPEDVAKNLLVYGFCEQVIEKIALSSMREAISIQAQRYLSRG